MEDSLHYLIMANQMLVQRGLLERLKNTGISGLCKRASTIGSS